MATRSRWSGVILALLAMPLLYALAFGPACWLSERWSLAQDKVSIVYRPVFWLANQWPRTEKHLKAYAEWGASPGAEADFKDNQLSWWTITFSSGTMRTFSTEFRCFFPAEESASGSPPTERVTESSEPSSQESANSQPSP